MNMFSFGFLGLIPLDCIHLRVTTDYLDSISMLRVEDTSDDVVEDLGWKVEQMHHVVSDALDRAPSQVAAALRVMIDHSKRKDQPLLTSLLDSGGKHTCLFIQQDHNNSSVLACFDMASSLLSLLKPENIALSPPIQDV